MIHRCLVWSLFVTVATAFGCFASPTNEIKSAAPPTSIKTNFVKGGELSQGEISQVLALAEQVGIKDAAEVYTYYCLPTVEKGITVKSKERADGRNISYDTIEVFRQGWQENSRPKVKRLGDFWINDLKKTTTLERKYELNKKTIRIRIGQGVDFAVADKIIAQVVAKKLHNSKNADYSDEEYRLLFGWVDVANITSLSEGQTVGEYELFIGEPRMMLLTLRVKGDDVFVTKTASVVI
jgi:hypothetical protein